MIYITIVNAENVELERHEVTADIPQDILESAARVTCELWNRDHPDDGWHVVVIDTDKEAAV